MGKFCVKAAIVSSLAIAEEDYDTAVGAPIVLKRNLVARSLKEGQTLEIISDGVSLRALSVAEEAQSTCCGLCSNGFQKVKQLGEDQFNGLTNQIKGVAEGLNTLTDKVKKEGNVLSNVSNFLTAGKDSAANLKEFAIKKTEEINNYLDEWEKNITGLEHESEDKINGKLEEIDSKIKLAFGILNLVGNLLPENAKTSLTTLTDKLSDVKKDLTNLLTVTGNNAKLELVDTIKTNIDSAKATVNDFKKKLVEWADKADNNLDDIQTLTNVAVALSNMD